MKFFLKSTWIDEPNRLLKKYPVLSQFKTIINNSKLYYISTNQTEESISLPQIKTVEGTNYITVNTSTSASNLKITTEK